MTAKKPARKRTEKDTECGVCRLPYDQHRAERCEVCGRPEAHHADGDLEAEWAGRARMAAAKRAAGLPLNQIDARALAKHPDPAFLSGATLAYTHHLEVP